MRSRLEARWAVFLDTIGLTWRYEPEGYELDGGLRYLPDFIIDGIGWLEIKGGEPDARDTEKVTQFALAQLPRTRTFMAVGEPYCTDWWPAYEIRQPFDAVNGVGWSREMVVGQCAVCDTISVTHCYPRQMFQCTHCDVVDRGWSSEAMHRAKWRWHKGDWSIDAGGANPLQSPLLMAAYAAARGAQFERGRRRA